jgi:hypothetical protein
MSGVESGRGENQTNSVIRDLFYSSFLHDFSRVDGVVVLLSRSPGIRSSAVGYANAAITKARADDAVNSQPGPAGSDLIRSLEQEFLSLILLSIRPPSPPPHP